MIPDLASFNTLQAAKDYEATATTMISNSTMRMYLQATGLLLVIHEVAEGKYDTPVLDQAGKETGELENNAAKEMALLITKSLAGSSTDNKDFNFIIGDTMGDIVISNTEALRDLLMPDHSDQIQTLLDLCKDKCNETYYPYISATASQFDIAKLEEQLLGVEEVVLPSSTLEAVYTLSIGVSAPKKIAVKIMQRFGDTLDDMTEWHEVSSFKNVYYKQNKYKAQVGSCDCTYRELKVVSDYQLNMSVS